MLDRALRPLSIASVVAALLVSAAPTRSADADMVLTADGKWWPLPEGKTLSAEDEPNDDLLGLSRDVRIDATYETVKSTNPQKLFNKPASFVRKIRSSDGGENAAFRQGLNDAGANNLNDAVDNFRTAAAALSGFAKQEALWMVVKVTAVSGDPDKTSEAIDELIAAFPKSFYFADAHIFKARIAKQKGDGAGIAAALDKIKNAPAMNSRDLYRAEQMRVFLTMELASKHDSAATEYRLLITRLSSDKDAAVLASIKQQCQVGLGNCLLATNKGAEARAQFEGAAESHDPDVLAGAYAGLGDIVLTEAKAKREAKDVPGAKAKLEEALLHYLRVTKLYATSVEEEAPVYRALENQAKVFRTLFEMSEKKTAELAERSLKTWRELANKAPQGPLKQMAIREYNETKKMMGP